MQAHVKNGSYKDEGDVGNLVNRITQRTSEVDELKYEMNRPNRGRLIIINNENFIPKHLDKRTGTDVDCENLKITFEDSLGFEVLVKKDATRSEMLQLMISESNSNHSDCDCFAVAVLTHGVEGNLYGTDELITIESFVAPIKDCKSLAGKPKLFFFQACRGHKFDDGVEVMVESESVDGGTNVPSLPRQKEILLPLEADFLYAYSTVPGYYAWRNRTNGSWFVQALTKQLKGIASVNLDLVRILTRVNHQVAYDFESSYNSVYPENSYKKEVPSIVSMLTKDLYFTQK